MTKRLLFDIRSSELSDKAFKYYKDNSIKVLKVVGKDHYILTQEDYDPIIFTSYYDLIGYIEHLAEVLIDDT